VHFEVTTHAHCSMPNNSNLRCADAGRAARLAGV
jgi:hypothetical protein